MFLGAPVNKHGAKQGTTYSNRDGGVFNHLQKKDVHEDTVTVPAPINEAQDWHSIPSGYSSFSCTQSWVTLDTSVLPQQQRNTVCDSALCHEPCHAFMCSAPKSSAGCKCRSTITTTPNPVDTGMIQNYSSERAELRDHSLPLSHRSLKGHVI